ncbi:MAG: serine hydrolase domain-containing protein [Actinomycetota bacterium]
MNPFEPLIEWSAANATRQLLITVGGERVVDECFDGDESTTTDIASLQKALSITVLGQLVDEGVMDLDAPVGEYVGAGWTNASRAHEAKVTVRNVVAMRSGLNDRFEEDCEPGTDWYYCNNAYHQVRKAMEVATGRESEPLFAQRLWGPLGMDDSSWKPRPHMKDPHGWVLSGVHTNAGDLDRFGRALLRRDDALGCTASFLDEVFTGSEANPSYGLLWWLHGGERAIVPGHRKDQRLDEKKVFGGVTLERRIAPHAPRDCVGGHGAGNQRIYLVPSQDMVVTRIGSAVADMNASGEAFDDAFWSRMPANVRNIP